MSEAVSTILEILKYTLPSGIVFVTAYYLLRQFFDERRNSEVLRIRAEAKSNVLPTRLQAYERLILLLERVEPTNLVARVYRPAMNAQVFQRELVKTIREEFEHNLAQQLYVSNEAWNQVNASKEAVMQLINLSAEKVAATASASELSNVLFEIVAKAGVSPTAGSIETLKNEARQLL